MDMSDEEDAERKLSDEDDAEEKFSDDDVDVDVDVEKNTAQLKKKRSKISKNEFIDDEAELSGEDDGISEDEDDLSDDGLDLDIVDKDAPELDSEDEEAVRGLYHKQLATEDRRAVLLLQEQFEEKELSIGQRRRAKFRWQTKELMENSLRRHYDPDDDESQEAGDDDDDIDYDELQPRLRRPTAESLLIGSTRITTTQVDPRPSTSSDLSFLSGPGRATTSGPLASTSAELGEDSNSGTMHARMTSGTRTATFTDMNRFLIRDKELVEALSTRETVITTREERDKVIQREIKRVLQSKSIFDQLYS